MRNVSQILIVCQQFNYTSYIFCSEDKIRYFQGRFDIRIGRILCNYFAECTGEVNCVIRDKNN
jgi:hypothetical protein